MSITFPYERKLIDEGEIIDPRITLEVKTSLGFLAIKFLVDSGADVTTLPLIPYGEIFNFQKKPKEKVKIGGIEGKGVNAYPFSLLIRLANYKFHLRSYFIESKIDPLLGRLDFWDLFSICFDNKSLKTLIISVKK